jgi:hypothetical protein
MTPVVVVVIATAAMVIAAMILAAMVLTTMVSAAVVIAAVVVAAVVVAAMIVATITVTARIAAIFAIEFLLGPRFLDDLGVCIGARHRRATGDQRS